MSMVPVASEAETIFPVTATPAAGDGKLPVDHLRERCGQRGLESAAREADHRVVPNSKANRSLMGAAQPHAVEINVSGGAYVYPPGRLEDAPPGLVTTTSTVPRRAVE